MKEKNLFELFQGHNDAKGQIVESKNALRKAKEQLAKYEELIIDNEKLTQTLTTVGVVYQSSLYKIDFTGTDLCEPFLLVTDYAEPMSAYLADQELGEDDE